ncbi:pilus retraction ATPase PilT [Verrucomicrobium sp. GAS474]|uniref:type IV pilus twitching motility protein PilT n=1 Tax=Verrucomicrobium sp. GAS474 TaxID=1882831 RepID=UPI00087B6892|nr:type IV pilus twitching motility protein PilT [Verrucomicrobium sp. GAS474]SDU01013.1 pilus retraction ATPase PilT [Verrucomicrobium sp. GAS474]
MSHPIHAFFEELIRDGGSDLHLLEGQPPKIRRHGEIRAIREGVLDHAEMTSLLQPIAKPASWQKFTKHGDLDFAYEMGVDARFRCNYYKQLHGYGAVFRIIPTKIKTIADLGVPEIIQSFGDLKSGLVLVTGPTGSGKSTTLAAVIDYINSTYTKHIVTIEEPIEFVHPNKTSIITQREVPSETPSFSTGLKAALREDADVILVGEMRDLETISLALTAAETGLLVFGTLHTNNARKTIDRIIDAFPSDQQSQIRTMLSNSLRGVCAQLLFKRKDGKGRLALNEILVATPAVGAIIREGATVKLTDVIKTGGLDGMQLMDDAIFNAMKDGLISGEEAYMKGIEKSRFEEYRDDKGA